MMRRVICLTLLLALTGCPTDGQDAGPDEPREPDAFDTFGALMRDEDGFHDELKRLQGLITDRPSLGSLALGTFDGQFALSSRIEPGRAGLVLKDRFDGQQWVLWLWRDESEAPPDVTLVKDESTAGGHLLELGLGDGRVTLSLRARWVQGRCLQLTREYMLGGLDLVLQLPESYACWSLEGPWLPYRMLPGRGGPYGVVDDGEADGAWHSRAYPAHCVVPAGATYSRQRGFLIAVADEHPRKLDRSYTIDYRVDPSFAGGEQLRLTYRNYDPAADRFAAPYLASGLAVRDSVVLEPLELVATNEDETLVEAETMEVIARLGALVRAFHFRPRPPKPHKPGNLVNLDEWLAYPWDDEETLTTLTGRYGVVLGEQRFNDAALGACAGLGAAGLEGGEGVAAQELQAVDRLSQWELPVLAQVDFPLFHEGDAFCEAQPGWIARLEDGEAAVESPSGAPCLLLDVRRPQVAAGSARKLGEDLGLSPPVAGSSLNLPAGLALEGQATDQGPFRVSYQAATSALTLRAVEGLAEATPEALLALRGDLSLGLPAFCGIYINDADGLLTSASGLENGASLVPSERLLTYAYLQLFGVEPYVDAREASLAGQVIAMTRGARGYYLPGALENYGGFEAFATHTDLLRKTEGEMRVIFSDPQYAGYTLDGERPAECTSLVAMIPADWRGSDTVWVAFHGVVGSVSVDVLNNITLGWGEAGEWSGKLPVGYWEIDHPEPEAVEPGDAVLIIKRQVPAVGMPGTEEV